MPRAGLVALMCVVVAGGALRGVAAADPGAYQSADEIAYTTGTYGNERWWIRALRRGAARASACGRSPFGSRAAAA